MGIYWHSAILFCAVYTWFNNEGFASSQTLDIFVCHTIICGHLYISQNKEVYKYSEACSLVVLNKDIDSCTITLQNISCYAISSPSICPGQWVGGWVMFSDLGDSYCIYWACELV